VTEHPTPWRTGTKGRQTIYDADPDGDGGQPGRSLGRMDTPALAARVVAAVNELEALRAALLPLSRCMAPIPGGTGGPSGGWRCGTCVGCRIRAALLRPARDVSGG